MSREAIIRQIVDRDLAHKDLSDETVRKNESALYAIACDEFGSWETALEYAGVDARASIHIDNTWNAQQVKKHLRRLCTTGYDLTAHPNRSRNHALYQAVLHHFGSWRAGLMASGINLANVSRRRPKDFTREAGILWLQERHAAGQTLVWTEVCLENRDYAVAIRRTFRSWGNALIAAGLQGPE